MDTDSSSNSENEANVQLAPRTRIYRQRINFNLTSIFEFNEKFRLNAAKMELILQKIGGNLTHGKNRNKALTAKEQLCICLRWLGNGGQYHDISDMHGISKSTVCRCITAVVRNINEHLFQDVVNWPQNVDDLASKFFAIKNFPLVAGCVDGTLIPIDAPNENEGAFVDRYGDHSINCMVVCGPNRKFYYASANWPGSVHDARVLRNSALFSRFEIGWRPFPNAVILGDGAYPLKEWLITPHCENDAERRFNRAQKANRKIIEDAIGILKEKFLCLNKLRIKPQKAGEIIMCCVTLCNLSKDDILTQPLEDESCDEGNFENVDTETIFGNENENCGKIVCMRSRQIRQDFINRFI